MTEPHAARVAIERYHLAFHADGVADPRRVWKHGVLDALVRREGDEIAVADPDHQPQREDAVEEPLARRRVPCGEDGIELERIAAHDERRGEEVEIGRASCRERVGQYGSITRVPGALKQKRI